MGRIPPGSRSKFVTYRSTLRERWKSESARGRSAADTEANAGSGGGRGGGEGGQKRRSRSFFILFISFWSLLKGHRRVVVMALATLSVATFLTLGIPSATKIAIDYVLTDNPGPVGLPDWEWLPESRKGLLWALSGAMIGVTLLSVVIGMIGRWQITRLTKLVQVRLRRRAFEHAVRLPLHRVQQLKSGGVSSILREDAGGTAELLFSLIYNPWRAIIQLGGTLIILAWVDWLLLVGAILLVPVVWLSHKTWIGRIRPVFMDIRKARASIDAHATEAFGGMRIVRGFARQQGEANRFSFANHLMARQEVFAWWWSRAVDISWQVLIPVASSAMLLYGGSRVIDQSLTIGDLMMFSTYLLMLLGPLEALVSSATNVQSQLAGLERTLDLLAEPLEFEKDGKPQGAQRSIAREDVRGRVTLDGVRFTYPGQTQEVIRGISLDVMPGETIAIVGSSGSGKTTLTNLIARFFDPTAGRVMLDGIDLRDVEPASYRRLLGIVEQDVFLFDGSIAENIAYARRGASDAEIRRAAEIANAHGFIAALEKSYSTMIGERGVRLSGGQKQRIALARAVLADPRILILDEATSNLDSESERSIQRSLGELLKGRTTFVIAHRLSTIRAASRIVVLEAGQVVESGTHEELSKRGGRYAALLEMQSLEATRT